MNEKQAIKITDNLMNKLRLNGLKVQLLEPINEILKSVNDKHQVAEKGICSNPKCKCYTENLIRYYYGYQIYRLYCKKCYEERIDNEHRIKLSILINPHF